MYLSLSVLVAVEIVTEVPFASRFSAAAGATELLLGWKVAQKIAQLAFPSNGRPPLSRRMMGAVLPGRAVMGIKRHPVERPVEHKVADRFQNIAIISVIPNMVKAGYRG